MHRHAENVGGGIDGVLAILRVFLLHIQRQRF